MSKKKSKPETVDQSTFDERVKIWGQIWNSKSGTTDDTPAECAAEAIEVEKLLRTKS
jgi:hypothetical protein